MRAKEWRLENTGIGIFGSFYFLLECLEICGVKKFLSVFLNAVTF